MSAAILSGGTLASEIRAAVGADAGALVERGVQPRLAVVVATEDESAAWYVRSIARSAGKVGIACDVTSLGPASTTADIAATLVRLSADPAVHGVILQTPLPEGAALADLDPGIAAGKDVDGANPDSLGRLAAGLPAFAPATAEAVLSLLDHAHIELRGRHAVVVGRSAVVGKPVAHLLLHRDATVTICHSRTADLARHSRDADVLVVAAGRPGMITGAQVRPGAVVIDVGTNPTADGGLVGDVEPVSTAEVAGALTPVPGGVGPVTSVLLLQHTVRAAQRQVRQ
jgi:methylenetetrahydrofolate dehydrogenase (NADP+)/methenyltetrahydrofolate cyclohydrolase